MNLHGEITTFIDALGATVTDERSLAAFALVDLPTARSDYDLGDSHRTYLKADEHGVEFLYIDGVLSTVFISITPNDKRGVYPRPAKLITGLSPTAARDAVRAFFGAVEWTSATADRFQLHEACFVRFGYVDEAVAEIGIARQVPQ